MADRRPGGIEKIAHLFIAGGGAGNLRARDNGHLRWTSPATPPDNGHGQGQGPGGVRESLPNGQTAADKSSGSAGQQADHTPAAPGFDSQKSALTNNNGADSSATDGTPGASRFGEERQSLTDNSGADGSATNGAAGTAGTDGSRVSGLGSREQQETENGAGVSATNGATRRARDESGASGESDGQPMAGAASGPSKALEALQSVLRSAKVAAVLSGHMGPLAGPAAELFAKTLAREGSRVAMLYGPADLACLHRFSASEGEEESESAGCDGNNGNGAMREAPADAGSDTTSCDVLLLPDWVFQFDLWPMSRGVHSICLAYGAGSEGLMSAYGALKGLIARFGKPEELVLLPFGCNEQEETWVHERLAEMCRRFLEIEPRLTHERPDVHVRASRLLPIDGGSEGVKQLFAAIGQPRLSIVPRREARTERRLETRGEAKMDRGGRTEGPVMARRPMQDVEAAAEVTPLVPVAAVPREGEAVLRALVESLQAEAGGFFDIWSRNGVAGTILGSEGLIGAACSTQDLLGFALWLCRQAQAGEIDELTSITIAVKQTDDWLVEASQAMPIPVRWLTWRAYQLGGQLGLGFEAC